jgi:hypothetical protein
VSAVPRRRLLLYGALAAGLLAANTARLAAPPEEEAPAAEPRAPLAALPEIAAAEALDGFAQARPTRDLFRRDAPPEPEPEPVWDLDPGPPRADPTAQAVAEARRALDGIALRGLLGQGEAMMAVVETEGGSRTVSLGESVLPGFTVSAIDPGGLAIRHDGLGIQQTYRLE